MSEKFIKKSGKIYLQTETEVKLDDLESQKTALEERKQAKITEITNEFDNQIQKVEDKITAIKAL
jgi:hypothetical protein